MYHLNYILKNRKPVAEPNLLKWARWYEDGENRIVGKTRIGKSEISTVFLGVDHSFGGKVPILWETMVFGGPLTGEMTRCAGSWEQAEAMHEKMVARVAAKQTKTKNKHV